MKYVTGLVVGKFCPLHKGHLMLLNAAKAACENLIVISYTSSNFPGCGASQREAWLKEWACADNITIVVIDPGKEHIPDDNAPELVHRHFCADIIFKRLGKTVQAVFTSEDYGDGFAEYLTSYFNLMLPSGVRHDVAHVCVDKKREKYPTSGTLIRAQLENSVSDVKHISKFVLQSFVPKIAILGGESSGKTTLASALARNLNCSWVEEFGRYWYAKRQGKLMFEDMEFIATRQIANENEWTVKFGNFVVCDTTALTTLFYSIQLFGDASSQLYQIALNTIRSYKHVFICASDIPFEQDGTRVDAEFRDKAFNFYVHHLTAHKIPFTVLTGSVTDRIAQAKRVII